MGHIARPDVGQLQGIATELGIEISDADMPQFLTLVDWALESLDALEDVPSAPPAPPVPEREFTRPTVEDNPLGAWYVRSDIRQEPADGPLRGKRVAIKDSIAVAGIPMSNGTAVLEGYIPDMDATVVQRVLAAGGTIAGKAVCEAFCASAASHTSHTGPVRNPYDLTRSTGGSSSGSAALVADRQVDMAIGSDQGGSIRGPSAWSGVYGLKPTYGLVPYTGAFPIEMTLDHLGPIAASVEDLTLLLSVIAGLDPDDPRQPGAVPAHDYVAALKQRDLDVQIGVLTEGFGLELSEPAVDDTVRWAIDRLGSLGLGVKDVSVPWHSFGGAIWAGIGFEGISTLMFRGEGVGNNWRGRYPEAMMQEFASMRRERGSDFPPTAVMQALTGQWLHQQYHGITYARAQNIGRRLSKMYDEAFQHCDVLLLPTMPMRARPLPDMDDIGEIVRQALEIAPSMMPFNISGHPAISIPCGMVDGLPVGLMAVGRRWEEITLLQLAKLCEEEVFSPSPPERRGTASVHVDV